MLNAYLITQIPSHKLAHCPVRCKFALNLISFHFHRSGHQLSPLASLTPLTPIFWCVVS